MSTTWRGSWPGSIAGRAGEALLDTYEQERRPVGMAATADSVANLEGMFEVVAALGLPRRAVRLLPRARRRHPDVGAAAPSAGSHPWTHHAGISTASPGQVGGQGRSADPAPGRSGHRRTGSALPQLGTRPRGAIPMRRRDDDGLPPPPIDPEFYMPCVRAGGRLPHSWVEVVPAGVHTGSGQSQ